MINSKSKTAGFTLIEALVYMALFGILMGGAIVAAYNLFESGSRNSAKIIIQEEGNFLLAKIGWALSGITAVNSPTLGSSGSKLSVTTVPSGVGSIDVQSKLNALGTEDIILTRGSETQTLNNSNINIEHLLFKYDSSGSVEWITSSFTINSKTADGKSISQNFEATKYLRK